MCDSSWPRPSVVGAAEAQVSVVVEGVVCARAPHQPVVAPADKKNSSPFFLIFPSQRSLHEGHNQN
ncbi:hypothetical protein MSG28_002243 [Choristoneura fumiferana]|uniref:Uncharacterized protein n=1 Tax=Choristoneura fumiferana TaxID=7141 RepID=A0ACC0JUM9_CHOFU|nr:hypothetical protein MSG28_002243 [Choristoneura fumiferana]